MLKRDLFYNLTKDIEANKVLIIFGPRRVGKSILLQQILASYEKSFISLNGEDLDDAERLSTMRRAAYDSWLRGIDLLVIDEAQAVANIGNILKLIIDSYTQLTIIATGSSAFDLDNSSGEPLVGRRIVYEMFPLSEQELVNASNPVDAERSLQSRLIYGSYPEVYTIGSAADKERYLRDLVGSYLLKDILSYENLKHGNKLYALLKLIAYQVGSEVSYDEIANSLRIDRNTVERYLNLLSKVFVIFRLGGYSGNLRKEVSKSSKWYFYDVGLRNAILGDFRSMEVRQDKGQIWENFFITERIKFTRYEGRNLEYYFWRTYDQQEIDLIEIGDQAMTAFEIKVRDKKNFKFPIAFRKAYEQANMELVTKKRYQSYLTRLFD